MIVRRVVGPRLELDARLLAQVLQSLLAHSGNLGGGACEFLDGKNACLGEHSSLGHAHSGDEEDVVVEGDLLAAGRAGAARLESGVAPGGRGCGGDAFADVPTHAGAVLKIDRHDVAHAVAALLAGAED